jgi:hypothetical protein
MSLPRGLDRHSFSDGGRPCVGGSSPLIRAFSADSIRRAKACHEQASGASNGRILNGLAKKGSVKVTDRVTDRMTDRFDFPLYFGQG